MQGNGAAPAGWGVVSIVILNAHKKKGFRAKILCPISKLSQHLAAVLYVNDTDLLHLDTNTTESADDAPAAIQASVHSWGNLLIATGGALKPEKCVSH